MRIVVGMMNHETNSFSPIPTTLADFAPGRVGEPPRGNRALEAYPARSSAFSGLADAVLEAGADISVSIAANAAPSGPVVDQAFESIADAILCDIRKGCDALLLDLHGAMITDSHDDAEGELLKRIRHAAPELPIGVAYDFHANMTNDMVTHATVVAGYQTYPHVDMHETGLRAGRALIRAVRGEIHPVSIWRSLPMLTHMLKQDPARQPMKDIMDMSIAAEGSGSIVTASVFGGFPLSDVPHVGLSVVVTADAGVSEATALMDRLCDLAWERREQFVYRPETFTVSIANARSLKGGMVLLVDHGDNCGAGGNQDVMAVLAEVIRQGLSDVAAGPIWDPAAVARSIEAGVGAKVSIAVGGKTDMPALNLAGRPLVLEGTVRCITDGTFTVTGPMMTGFRAQLGRTVVLDTGSVEVLLSERRAEPYDLGVFAHAGIDVRRKRYVLIKSRQHFRAAFAPVAKHIVLVAGPGVCSSDYIQFPFARLRRPIYPLDLETSRTD